MIRRILEAFARDVLSFFITVTIVLVFSFALSYVVTRNVDTNAELTEKVKDLQNRVTILEHKF